MGAKEETKAKAEAAEAAEEKVAAETASEEQVQKTSAESANEQEGVDTQAEETEGTENTADADEASAADESAESEAGEEAAEESGKKKRFGRKEKKDPRDDKIVELTDQVKRQMAEFDNFRKRTEKEKASMYEMGAKAVIEKILPVIDNFERGLATVPEDGADGFADGMKMIYKQLIDELDKLGVKPIEALGQPFDPNFHNAVMQVESEEYESGVVAQELLKGYMYRDSVVRHSMVAVVQ